MTTQRTGPTFWQRLSRLLLFALIVAAIIIALYYATPYLYRDLVAPTQNNRLAIEQLQRSQTQWREDLEQQLAEQRQRLGQLENELAAEREARSELETRLSQQAETIAAQATAQAEVETRFETQAQAITTLEQSLDGVDAALTDLDTAVTGVEQAAVEPEAEMARLQRWVLLLQIQQAALKTHLHLVENNIGQARLAFAQAGQILGQLRSLPQPGGTRALTELEAQWQETNTTLEERPLVAVQRLEIFWQALQEVAVGERSSAGEGN